MAHSDGATRHVDAIMEWHLKNVDAVISSSMDYQKSAERIIGIYAKRKQIHEKMNLIADLVEGSSHLKENDDMLKMTTLSQYKIKYLL